MSVLNQPAANSYPISNEWLAANAANPAAYIDMTSIVMNGTADPYIAWLIANGVVTTTGATAERARAKFMTTGIIYYDDDNGTAINSVMVSDPDSYAYVRQPTAGIVHWLRIRRIYAQNTTARSIEIVGYI